MKMNKQAKMLKSNNLTLSYLRLVCDANNKANNFVQLEDDNSEMEQSTWEANKLARLWLKLADETFLALPLDGCQKIYQNSSPEMAESRAKYDACSVDWFKAKVLNLNVKNGQEKEITPLNFLLSNNKNLTRSISNFFANNKPVVDYNLVKMTYLSLSSLLSTLGIIINIFIILIMIFNTKQKRRSIIRNNKLSQNNLLLFQLTFTGILLASHVLLENLNMYNLHEQDEQAPKLSPPYYMSHIAPMSHETAHSQQLPLFNFLPPSPFSSWQRQGSMEPSSCRPQNIISGGLNNKNYQQFLDCSCDKGRAASGQSVYGGDLESDPSKFVLVLNFAPTKSASLASRIEAAGDESDGSRGAESLGLGDNRGAWKYLEYHVKPEDDGNTEEASYATKIRRRLIDLNGFVGLISIGESSCPKGSQNDKVNQEVSLDGSVVSNFSLALGQQDNNGQQNSETEYSSRTTVDDSVVLDASRQVSSQPARALDDGFRLLLMELLPIFINVIASIHIWTVAALAYDRYCAIAHPLQYLRSIHTSRVRTFFIASWAISLLLNLFWPLSLSQIINHQWSESQRQHDGRTLAQRGRNDGRGWASGLDLDQLEPNRIHSLQVPGADMHGSGGCQFTVASHAGCFSSYSTSLPAIKFCPHDRLENFAKCPGASLVRRWLAGEIDKGNLGTLEEERSEDTSINGTNLKVLQQLRGSLTIELTTLLLEQHHKQTSSQPGQSINATTSDRSDDVDDGTKITGNLYIVLLVTYSLLGFLVIILAPLLVITVCNIMIYRIVKVHERRLSINSGSNINTSASNLNNNNTSHNYQIHNHHSQSNQKLRTNKRDLLDDRSDTSSITSILVAQLVKVGLIKAGPGAKHQEDGQMNYSSDQDVNNQLEHCNHSSPSAANNCNSKTCDCDRNSSVKLDCLGEDNITQLHNRSEPSANGITGQQTTVLNRSKRVIIRQDSYQILAKLKAGPTEAGDQHGLLDLAGNSISTVGPMGGHSGHQATLNSTNRISHSQHQPQQQGHHRGIKRKTSDQMIRDFNDHRKDSNTSQLSSDFRSDFNGVDNYSFNNDPYDTKVNHNSGGGIINQLKLAGLSFAGIAIQASPGSSSAFSGFNFGKPTLQKSSSCSLGNLNIGSTGNHHVMQQGFNNGNNLAHINLIHGSSVSRCSMETSSSVNTSSPRRLKSHISLLSNACKQQDINNSSKYLTKLLDDESYTSPQPCQSATGHHHHHHFNHNNPSRLPFTLGTKSPAFNVVIWLILTLLIFTLPHYLIVTVNQISRLNPPSNSDRNILNNLQHQQQQHRYNQLIGSMMDSIIADPKVKLSLNFNSSQPLFKGFDDLDRLNHGSASQTLWETSSIWLSCLSRILFLSIVPLNGWLYGIRSRSLRATLRIVLKRYISRRQASIEISRRQRSISSVRSRDSSFMNLPNLYHNHNSSTCASCNHRISMTESPQRVFRRCSSFSGTKRDNELRINSSSQPFVFMNYGEATTNATEEIQRLVDDNGGVDNAGLPVIKSKSTNGNTIRFLIGDCDSDRDFDNMTTYDRNQQASSFNHYCSQNTSPALSLAGSHRSLMSASIHSANSILFDDRRSLVELLEATSTNQMSQKSSIKRSAVTAAAPQTKLAYDNYGREITELDQKYRNITASSQNYSRASHDKFSCNFDMGSNQRTNFDLTSLGSREAGHGNLEEQQNKFKTIATGEQGNKSNPNDSFSGETFRFFVTSADQRQHVIDFDHNEANLAYKKDMVTGLQSDGCSQTKLSENVKVEQVSNNNWWAELKANLTKMIYNSSAIKLLTSDSVIERRPDGKYYVGGNNGSQRLESSDQTIEAENQCSRALLRKNSIDGCGLKWHQSLLADRLNIVSSSASSSSENNRKRSKKKRLRASLTLDNIDSIDKDKFGAGIQCSKHQSMLQSSKKNYRDCNGSTKTLDQSSSSSTYLKPPNFLKLIFDPNNHSNPYSGASALSPIKECSSNHSYASSQSSLNNTNLQHQMVTHMSKASSMSEINIKLEAPSGITMI